MNPPSPLPEGTKVQSSGSGWIAHGYGGRFRAGKGRIIKVLRFEDGDHPGWLYEVIWDSIGYPTHRHGDCLCPVDHPLEALADCANEE